VDLTAERAEELLAAGTIEVLGLLPGASNYTFAVSVNDGEIAAFAVYKPQKGEYPLWDFPDGTLYKREIAAYLVSQATGWNLVPPTIAREGDHGIGSLQLYIDHDPEQHYLTLMPARAEDFKRVAAFDVVINNADRKSGHCLLQRGSLRLWYVDHGVSFHEEEKLRTVIWDFAGEPLGDEILAGLQALHSALKSDELRDRLKGLLEDTEIVAMELRLRALLDAGVFPDPPEDRRPYPWPPV
jgi:uncharacterized repeat protein (TIGR03843 family)